ncbi:MAG: nuclear transport factor 2 family protein [Gemmatimonadaceae bacterium]
MPSRSHLRRTLRNGAVAFFSIALVSVSVSAQGGAGPAVVHPVDRGAFTVVHDSGDVAATVTRFHAALAAGDSAAVLALLADDVWILESGGVETRAEYRSHHLKSDIEFARALPAKAGPLTVRIRGDVAWVSGTSVTQGDFKGRAINSASAELVVLSREGSEWKIRAVHWSSRTRRS